MPLIIDDVDIVPLYGLKLNGKEVTLADFFEEFCCDKAVDILYKKSYGKDKGYLAESLRCVSCLRT